MSNKKKLVTNTFIVTLSYFIQTIIGFLVRKVFIDKLGVIFLGYNAVFTNILTLLNLSELGIGISANAFLYKSLAEDDKETTVAIFNTLHKLYKMVCVIIILIGIIIALFIPMMISNHQHSYTYIYIYYVLVLLSTIFSYMMADRKTVVSANQENYIVSLTDCISYATISIAQIIILLKYSNYFTFLILNIIKQILSSLIIYAYTKRKYSYLNYKNNELKEQEVKNDIKKEMKNIFVSKVGGIIFHGTDNIIISSILGTIQAGLISNYTMITNILQNIIAQFFGAMQSTLGNIIHKKNSKIPESNIYIYLYYISFIMGIFAMMGIIKILPAIIVNVFGIELILSQNIATILGINCLLLTLLQVPNQIFAIHKLYRFDKVIVGISAILNIIISIILVYIIGMEGVLIGTLITLLIYLISRSYIIKKHVYNDFNYKDLVLKLGLITIVYLALFNIPILFDYKSNMLYSILINSVILTIELFVGTIICLLFDNNLKTIFNIVMKEKNK